MNRIDADHHNPEDDHRDSQEAGPPTEEEIRQLAEDIVRYCPSLTHLLLALGSSGDGDDPLAGLN